MKRITFACSDELEQRLNLISQKADQSRSTTIEKMLNFTLDYLELSGVVGIYDFNHILRHGKEGLARLINRQATEVKQSESRAENQEPGEEENKNKKNNNEGQKKKNKKRKR